MIHRGTIARRSVRYLDGVQAKVEAIRLHQEEMQKEIEAMTGRCWRGRFGGSCEH